MFVMAIVGGKGGRWRGRVKARGGGKREGEKAARGVSERRRKRGKFLA